MQNKYSIIAIATIAVVAAGLIAILALTQKNALATTKETLSQNSLNKQKFLSKE
jgi:hypothetical protein